VLLAGRGCSISISVKRLHAAICCVHGIEVSEHNEGFNESYLTT